METYEAIFDSIGYLLEGVRVKTSGSFSESEAAFSGRVRIVVTVIPSKNKKIKLINIELNERRHILFHKII